DPLDRNLALIFEAAQIARRRDAMGSVIDRINVQISSKTTQSEVERRQRQMQLSERFMATVLIQAPDAIFALGLDGEVRSANDAPLRMFDARGDDLIGQSVLDLFAPSARTEIGVLWDQARAGNTVDRYESLSRDGAREVAISLANVHDAENHI